MPGTGYDREAAKIGPVRGNRPWWFRYAVLLAILGGLAVAPALARLFR
jgi:hypothetical protein